MSTLQPPARLTRRGIPHDPHLRVLALLTLVDRFGRGATLTTFALYFTRVVGLRPTAVGAVLSAAAFVAFLTSTPLGMLADRYPPKRLLVGSLLALSVVALGYCVARDLLLLALVAVTAEVLNGIANGTRNMLIARVGGSSGQAVAFKAYLRAVTNVGIAAGAALGGIALWVDRPWAYLAVFVFDALSYAVSGLVSRRLPPLPPLPPHVPPVDAAPPRRVWRDHPYVTVITATSLWSMHFHVIDIATPVWVAAHTAAPTWVVAAMLILNTVAVALLQVRMSRGVTTVPASGRALVLGAVLIAAGFTSIALASVPGRVLAVLLLLGGAAFHVAGEMVGSAGQWGLSFGLAPVERQGEYQGLTSTGWALSGTLGPILATWLCLEHGEPGWAAMSGIILAAAVAAAWASRWALANRAAYGVSTHTG